MGCASRGQISTTTVIPPYEPLVGLRDGDTHKVYIRVFCGADYLPIGVNEITWRADELDIDDRGWIPREWSEVSATIDDTSDLLLVDLRMESNQSRLVATANGRSVVYRPMTPDDPANECE